VDVSCEVSDVPPGVLDRALLRVSHPVLDLREGLLDRIEVGRIWREIPEAGTGCADHLSDGVGLVRAEIVHNDDIAGLEHRHELLLDISTETRPVDRPVKDARGGQAVASKRTEECQRAPVTMGRKAAQALAFFAPAIEWGHVGLDPGFINEDQSFGIETRLKAVPALPASSDVGTGLFKGEQRFF
jgi:hypothetical protein